MYLNKYSMRDWIRVCENGTKSGFYGPENENLFCKKRTARDVQDLGKATKQYNYMDIDSVQEILALVHRLKGS